MSRVWWALVMCLVWSGVQGCSALSDFERFTLGDADGGGAGDGGAGDGGVDAGVDASHDAGTDGGAPGPIRVAVTGDGRVTSDPAGLDCPGQCEHTFDQGASVTLTATPGEHQQLIGWGGACSGAEATCTLTAGAQADVTVEFGPVQYAVSVVRGGTGAGVVTSADGALRCDGSAEQVCSALFDAGSEVTLTGTAVEPDTFAGFGGDCSGIEPCTFTVTGEVNVTALFDAEGSFSLLVAKEGSGAGTVVSTGVTPDPGAPAPSIDCGTDCGASFAAGSQVTLEASPAPSSQAVVWGGACEGQSGNTCTVTMDSVKTVTASFSLRQHTLMVIWDGSPSDGSVAFLSPVERSCQKGQPCAEVFDYGTRVTLEATPADNSDFAGWTQCGSERQCEVEVTQDVNVQPLFALKTYTVLTGVGAGSGSVVCDGAACPTHATHGEQLTFSAVPTPGSGMELSAWTGDCAGTPTDQDCVIIVERDVVATAEFSLRTYTVQVAVSGGGSVEGDLACAQPSCEQPFEHGSALHLTAAPASGQRFAGWSGDCEGSGDCVVDPVTSDLSITANFIPDSNSVVVSKTGRGTIVSSPAGIQCGDNCSVADAMFDAGVPVQLTATPATGYDLGGFAGCDSVDGNVCTVTLSAGAKQVDVTFTPQQRTLQVAFEGNGGGGVVSDPMGLDCHSGAACAHDFPFDTSVVLTPSADEGSAFTGWSGDCDVVEGTQCTVTMNGADAVTATFAKKRYTLNVSMLGGAAQDHEVQRSPGGDPCPADPQNANCAVYDHGTQVTMTAVAGVGSDFSAWSGVAGCGGASQCVFTITANTSAQALFVKEKRTLNVTVVGSAGSVQSGEAVPLISCSEGQGDCTEDYDYGAVVTLTPLSGGEQAVFNWEPGPCQSYGSGPCTLELTAQPTEVTGRFRRVVDLTVTLEGDGAWGPDVLASDGEALNCGRAPGYNCTAQYLEGDQVELVAYPPAWAVPEPSWEGCDEVGGSRCVVALSATRSVNLVLRAQGALMFVSSATFRGDMAVVHDPLQGKHPPLEEVCGKARGYNRASCYCQALADRRSLPPKSFRAWLSDSEHHAIDQFGGATRCTLPIVLPYPADPDDPRVLITEGGGLESMLVSPFGGKIELIQPIMIDEWGELHRDDEPVWTGTDSRGRAAEKDEPWCADWTDPGEEGLSVGVGLTTSTDLGWTAVGTLSKLGVFSCNRLPARLYCVQNVDKGGPSLCL